jgi:hypothetical protein
MLKRNGYRFGVNRIAAISRLAGFEDAETRRYLRSSLGGLWNPFNFSFPPEPVTAQTYVVDNTLGIVHMVYLTLTCI